MIITKPEDIAVFNEMNELRQKLIDQLIELEDIDKDTLKEMKSRLKELKKALKKQ